MYVMSLIIQMENIHVFWLCLLILTQSQEKLGNRN